ncbi:PREDICTED: melanoma-associated antigen B1-like [Elephantulus edwardii]|uniref:melanoma-associated antigen B1-like n=1 Tax=Elephantulus edwardii TaxID=28737 RepID=UPI0003F07500|nr:PREDICTED: melanoma-associated antigen B1-like [Elephantulus edwardii]
MGALALGAAAGASYTGAEGGAPAPDERRPSSCDAPPSADSYQRDPLIREADVLMHFLLKKYKTKEPVMKKEMMMTINKKYKVNFPEILRRTLEQMELVFGLILKEVDPSTRSYILISKFSITNEESLNNDGEFPRNGILMPLLGIIFLKGNRATEEEMWEFLGILGLFDGRKHVIFGEPRKLITQDLVQEKYVEYRQVPRSDPPRYEFLWGPRAHTETSKMQVLEFLAKIKNTTPSAFPAQYEEALRDQERRARVTRAPETACELPRGTQGRPPNPSQV